MCSSGSYDHSLSLLNVSMCFQVNVLVLRILFVEQLIEEWSTDGAVWDYAH